MQMENWHNAHAYYTYMKEAEGTQLSVSALACLWKMLNREFMGSCRAFREGPSEHSGHRPGQGNSIREVKRRRVPGDNEDPSSEPAVLAYI
jgi:hypothetical protein